MYTVREAAKLKNIDAASTSYAIQGFGNAGQFAATLHSDILGGGKLLAVSDSRGGVFCKTGMDPQRIVHHKLESGGVANFPGTEPITNEALLELDVDVLYPSALENAITADNAERIKAKIVCELANGPTTPEADRILFKNGVFVIPDFLANAGGVTVSYFEQVQNTYNYYWSLEDVHSQLDRKMTDAFNEVYAMSQKEKTHMRLAAYLVAVSRVAEACKLRGWT